MMLAFGVVFPSFVFSARYGNAVKDFMPLF
jgi:hypothetical protein